MNLLSRVFMYELPTEIAFGVDAIHDLPLWIHKLKGTKVFIVSDPGVVQAGILDKVTAPLARSDVSFQTFTEVDREPDVTTISRATAEAKAFGADLVIGVGGGSAQDAAKAIGVMVNNDGKITQYAGLNNIPNPGVPIICIPTTAGTGSEVTIWTVISEKENNRKFGIGGKYLAPTLALCDPALTLSLPGPMTAATGIDALTHALESFVNKATQPISEALSRESMRLIAKSLRKAVAQGDNLEARYDMLLASTIAAMAFNPTRLGLAHALCMPLGGKFKVPHGVANAVLLPQVMQFNLTGNLEKFKEIAEIFGENTAGLPVRAAAELSVKAIKQLNRDVGILSGFSEYGVTENDLDYIAQEGMESGNVLVNPRKPSLEDLKEIVRQSI
jgi:alcohol dehydrogenase class IV